MVEQLEFRVLRPLEVRRGKRALPLRGTKQRLLLAYLLLHRNEVVPTERLVTVIWPRDPPPTAQKMVRMQAAELRRVLGGDAGAELRAEPHGFRLDVERGQIDLDRFDDLVAAARASLEGGDPRRAAADLRDAVGLADGAPLGDLAREEGARSAIALLEERRLGALEARIDADLQCGRHGELVAELEWLVAEHPGRERLATQLMLALYRSGRQVAALEVYRRAREELVADLGVEPGPALRRLHQQILRQDSSLDGPARIEPVTNLPAAASPLIGRERELEEASALLLDDRVRLLTLTGAPGSGKTRLAYELAARLRQTFADGVVAVELGPVPHADLVLPGIAHALGVEERPGEELLDTLRGHLSSTRLLLLLDNFEHVLDAAPALAELLGRAPRLKAVVTSRAPLEITPEHEYPVSPLPVPSGDRTADLDELAGNPAVALLVERARAVDPSFRLTRSNAPAVASIVARVDGLPLALELAAARLRSLSPEELLSKLDTRLALLTGGARDLPPRQRTLRATLDWSHRLLAPEVQLLFGRLSVFAGGWSLRAAEQVCGSSALDLVDGVAALVESSLLVGRPADTGEARFTMLETVREYAREKLRTSGEAAAVERRHAAYVADFVEEAEEHLWGDAEEAAWLARIDADRENLRTALLWARDGGDRELLLRLAAGSGRYWFLRGHLTEGRAWLDAALAEPSPDLPGLEAKAARGRAIVAHFQGDVDEARSWADRARRLYEQLGDERGLAAALNALGSIAIVSGDAATARVHCERAVAIRRRLDDRWGLATALVNLAVVATAEGELERAVELEEEALALFRELGDDEGIASVLCNLGEALLLTEGRDIAHERFCEALAVARRADLKHLIANALVGIAAVAASRGDGESSALLLGAADHVLEASGFARHLATEAYDEAAAETVALLGPKRAEHLMAHGRELGLDEAVALALAGRVDRN